MNRRDFLTASLVVIRAAPASRLTASEPSSTPKNSPSPPALKLFVDRKERLAGCMRGYLLTQAPGERAPTVACYVLERPPDGNAPYVSAIPAGTYPVRVRKDGTRGWRLQLDRVPQRTEVQIHVGNYPNQTLGCLLPGAGALPATCAVQRSAEAMTQLRTLFGVFGEDGVSEITIRDI
jgi:hypothetical protein